MVGSFLIFACHLYCELEPHSLFSRGMLKIKIQAMCWVTISKVVISNVKGKCTCGQKFWFLNSTSNHIIWPLIWKLMLHWFQKCYLLCNIYTMTIVTSFYMFGEKPFLQRKLSPSISSSDKTFPKIAKFIRKWFLFQYTWWKF